MGGERATSQGGVELVIDKKTSWGGVEKNNNIFSIDFVFYFLLNWKSIEKYPPLSGDWWKNHQSGGGSGDRWWKKTSWGGVPPAITKKSSYI